MVAAAKKTVKKASPKSDRQVKYDVPSAILRGKLTPEGALTVAEAMDLIGWTETEPTEEYALKDLYGKCIQLANSPTNRPFKMSLAERYANEMLRKKWAFNLESIVADVLGHIQQGQHRLVGFILAEQERAVSPHLWGEEPLVLETLLGFGADDSADTADTYDTGSKRSLADVFYRHQDFGRKLTDSQQKAMAKVLAGAIRLVWLRQGGQQVSFAPHFPHSEATEFQRKHPGVVKCVAKILELDAEGALSALISQAYASGLMYMMEKTEHGSEKAHEFWSLFTSGAGLETGNPILTLRQLLTKQGASSGSQRDDIISLVIKAWLGWVADETMTIKQLSIKKTKEGESFVAAEWPQLGGIDCTPINQDKLVKGQLLLMSLLKAGPKTYAELAEGSGQSIGQISKYILKESKGGVVYPYSLCTKDYVKIETFEDAPTTFSLTKKGMDFLK